MRFLALLLLGVAHLKIVAECSEAAEEVHSVCYDDIQESSERWIEPKPERFYAPDETGEASTKPSDRPYVTFWNNMNRDIELIWDSQDTKMDDINWGVLKKGKSASYTSQHHHHWFARDAKTHEILQDLFIKEGQKTYGFIPQKTYEMEQQKYNEEREKFLEDYYKATGRKWISVYPRDPPKVFLWEPQKVGYRQIARTTAGFWYNESVSVEDCVNGDGNDGNDDTVKKESEFLAPDPQSLTVTVETLSVSPAVFAFHNVMSGEEADLIIQLADKKGMKRSLVTAGGVVSDARTSNNTWLSYNENPVVTNIFHRMADLMNIDRLELTPGHMAESIQVAHYAQGQQYRDHHDFLDPAAHKSSGRIQAGNNRLATFLFYLNDVKEGGQTAFSLSDPTPGVPGSAGVSVLLPKGSAILFYNMLPDGNLDEMCLHAGRPPTKGEKYIANLWLWEPKFM